MTNSEFDQRLNAIIDKYIHHSNIHLHNKQQNHSTYSTCKTKLICNDNQHNPYYLNQSGAFDNFMLNWGIGLSTALIMLITAILCLFL